MDEGLSNRIRSSLTTKRRALRQWAETAGTRELQDTLGPAGRGPFEHHLAVLDTAIAEAEDDTLGRCTVCHGKVDSSLIQMDYTSSVCLDHLSPEERHQLEADLEMAGAVQRSLLPQRPPEVPRLEIAAFSRPAQAVGGDYFDFFPFGDGRQGVVISDVAGHGMSASLIMASLQTMLRTLAQEYVSPAELTARINRLCLHNIQFTTFITLLLGAFDPASREFAYCNAGHNPPVLIRSNGAADWLNPTGAAIGLTEDSRYVEASVSLAVGDLLFLYTDGLTETADPGGELLGSDRLAKLVRNNASQPARELIPAVLREVEAFAAGAPPADDRTAVALRIVG